MNGRIRKNWEEYALILANTAAEARSEDPHIQCGAVALRKEDNSVASVGYNGSPSKIDIDWSDRDIRRKKIVHAEVNCLKYTRPGEIGLLATTLLPCPACLATIAAYKIPKVVYSKERSYQQEVEELAKEFKIELKQLHV